MDCERRWQRAAVTGSTGHLGPSLIRALLARGYVVRALVFDRADALDGLPIERIAGDVRDRASLARAFQGQDVVFHCAGMISLDSRKRALMHAINADGADNAAQAALEAGVRRFVHVSSVHAFSLDSAHGATVDERSPRPDPRSAPAYDVSKAEGELRVRAHIARGLDAVVLNPTGFIGPDDGGPSLVGSELITLAKEGSRLLTNGSFDWLDPRDVARTAVAAAERGHTGEGYLLTGGRAHASELARLVDAATGTRRRRMQVPLWLARSVAALEPLGRRMMRWHPGLSADALNTLVADPVCDGSKARRELGHQTRPLWESVRDALLWWAERGMVAWTPRLRALAAEVGRGEQPAVTAPGRTDDEDRVAKERAPRARFMERIIEPVT